MEKVALAWTDVGVGERLVELKRFGLHPFAVLPVESLLGNLTDIDFGVEVGGKRLVVIAGIAIHNVEILYLVEVVFCGISGEDARHARVETATEDGAQASLLETLAISPLP